MTFVNLRKTLKIQESLKSENLTEHYLCKGIFLYLFVYPERYYTSKVKRIIRVS